MFCFESIFSSCFSFIWNSVIKVRCLKTDSVFFSHNFTLSVIIFQLLFVSLTLVQHWQEEIDHFEIVIWTKQIQAITLRIRAEKKLTKKWNKMLWGWMNIFCLFIQRREKGFSSWLLDRCPLRQRQNKVEVETNRTGNSKTNTFLTSAIRSPSWHHQTCLTCTIQFTMFVRKIISKFQITKLIFLKLIRHKISWTIFIDYQTICDVSFFLTLRATY